MTRQHTVASAPAEGLKMVVSAAAGALTLGGWAALTAASTPASTADAPPPVLLEQQPIPTLVPLVGVPASDVAAHGAAPALREVSAPPVTTRPAPVTFTRSSR